eukprot:TRINITY_DN68220_c0_g1_i1.p1 TRINITY_DN68220_c0_g1~~TRINITY_DN68220_c0_g1_i1.p1  ORF type:complete len:222 (+),score=33.21 TRINITY_DN68220_c0_g1_i1:47-712(+)
MPSGPRAFLNAVAGFGKKHPVIFGCSISALKTSSSDFVAQTVVEKKDRVDWRRNSVFFAWGLFYLGGVQYFIYVRLFAQRFFPGTAAFAAKPIREKIADKAGQKAVMQQVFLDQFVHHPFLLFPAFYQVKEFIEGGKPEDAFRKYRKNCLEDCAVCWSIWVPAFALNFSFCPVWMRVPFVAVVSFGFTIILSCMRGAQESLPEPTSSEGSSARNDSKGERS